MITATTVQRYRQLPEYYRFKDTKVKQIGGQRVMIARRNQNKEAGFEHKYRPALLP